MPRSGPPRPRALVVLEVMWGWDSQHTAAAQAPRYYRINPHNHTGKRIYKWLGHRDVLVTNACPQLVETAKGRGKPDADCLRANIAAVQPRELLWVCGAVADATWRAAGEPRPIELGGRVVRTPHPAARIWTRAAMDTITAILQAGQADGQYKIKNGFLQRAALTTIPATV